MYKENDLEDALEAKRMKVKNITSLGKIGAALKEHFEKYDDLILVPRDVINDIEAHSVAEENR